ncbi:MAG: aerobic respiration control sensor protein ArcB [Methanocella sp. PtaU1.Bin125]|nr:MAG: aerobic respiration control sensor protein ArcB [Methanocella sp. PtaU1.Bin125]
MTGTMRSSGIEAIGDVPWGTHFCVFYHTRQDLIDVIVPFFKAGLESGEFCMCVTSEPFTKADVKRQMARAIPGFDQYLNSGQMDVMGYNEWYAIDGVFNSDRVLNGWVEKLRKARERGFSGLRLTGNTFWLEKTGWKAFMDYEDAINKVIGQHNMIAMCTYSLQRCDASDILDVVGTHEFALTRREGEWKIVESVGFKETKEALKSSEAKFRALFEGAGMAMFVAEVATGHIVDCNRKAEELIGRPREEIIGLHQTQLHPAGMAEKQREQFARHVRGIIIDNDEALVQHRDGRVIPVIVNAAPLEVNGRQIMIGFFLDNTGRKRAEKALEEAKTQAELYLDLMSHDINNMHQIALGYLELAKELPPGPLKDEMIEKPVEVLQRSARLIKNVRKMQKFHEGAFQTTDINVAKLLADVRREFGAVPGKTIRLDLNGHDHCIVRGNELLHDIFANLVSNAIRHTGDRADIGISLDVVNNDMGRCCQVSVEDDGPGIPDELKESIFNRLLKSTAKTRGMGLGLYLVKSLVDSYGGRVWVEDRIKGDHRKGARFVVMLPVIG